MHHLSWRQISFSTNITYRTGYYFFRDVLNYSSLLSGINSHADYYRRWQQPGDEQFTDVPSLVYPADAARQHFYQEAEVNVERGDHVRIQDMVLNYRLNPDIARRWGMAQLHLSLQAQNMNVFLWRANQKGIDPDYRGIPIPPTYSMGLNVKF